MKKYSKQLLGERARKKILAGAKKVYDYVSTTLGARGRNITLWKFHETKSIHDGVKVANFINPKNEYENAGAEMLKQAARATVDSVGDGTTLTVILGYAIAKEAEKLVSSGVNPMSLRAGLERGKDLLVEEVKKLSQEVKTINHKKQVAKIAAQSEELGSIIGDTLDKAGLDGVVTVEQTTSPETYVEKEKGLQIDRGWIAEHFVTNPQKKTATINNANIFVTNYKLDNVFDFMPVMENVIEVGKKNNLVIFCEDMSGNMLATFIQNKLRGIFQSLAVKAPNYQTDDILRDLCAVTGATFISKESYQTFENVTVDDLGKADRVVSSMDATLIMDGAGNKDLVKKRIESIKDQIENEDNEFNKQKLRERLARLAGGVYVIYIGGQTDIEKNDKEERVDDALRATRTAIETGIIPGGETVFLHIKDVLNKYTNKDEEYAFRILGDAILLPFEKLVSNAGMNAGKTLAKIEGSQFGTGVDVITGELTNLREKGIIDPAGVVIEAIRNAVSVAIAIITSDGIVCEIEDAPKQ